MHATTPTPRLLLAPLAGIGLMMTAYLLLRPYGDAGADPGGVAAAFTSPWWVVAHLCGVLAIAQFARLALRLDEWLRATGVRSIAARAARTLALVGAVLCLPYYGAETFGLHALGRAHLASPEAGMLAVVDQVRDHPAALTTFGLGLVSLSAAAVLVAVAWAHHAPSARWTAWPVCSLMVLFPAQFYLPPVGRAGFGVLLGVAAAVWLVVVVRQSGAWRGGQQVLSEGSGRVLA